MAITEGIKISALTETVGLNSADVFPVVQGGVNKQAPVSAIGSYLESAALFATTAQGALADTAMQPTDGEALIAGIMMVGEIRAFAFNTPPAKWLEFGQTVSRATYAALFAKIGVTWGAGDGATTFALPPKGAFLRSWDGSASFGTLIDDSIKSHDHVITDYDPTLSVHVGPTSGLTYVLGKNTGATGTTATTGTAETAPKHINVLECIYAGV